MFDSLGIGALPDAAEYGDAGADTLGHVVAASGGLELPVLQGLGLGNISPALGLKLSPNPQASYGRMSEMSAGKDTTVGLWEMMGLITERPFPVFPGGFPAEVVKEFEETIGTRVLGNTAASGTEIIDRLGAEHMKTGYPIVYTSADSVFQIAAHEDVVPVQRLYEMCSIARGILTGKLGVDRVIARPFVGEPGRFVRTDRRKDFGLAPSGRMLLDYASEAGLEVAAVGKVWDVFSGRGITESRKAKNNGAAMAETTDLVSGGTRGIILTILADFDTLWGHRNDVEGYAKGLLEADKQLGGLMKSLKDGDALFITADHGCDPVTQDTDHTREYVPLLACGQNIKAGVDLGTRRSMADLGKTVAEMLGVETELPGESFANDILMEE